MKMKRLYTLAIFTLFFVASTYAQAVIVFEKQRHDFGTIEEQGGNVSYDFAFHNKGNEPLVISKVRTSCGCTVPEYSEEAIAPGDSGHVKITFNPSGRPGKFSKSVYVHTNTIPERTILRILGEVTQSKTAVLATQYAYRIGDIALDALHMPLSTIVKGRVAIDSISVANVGADTLVPRATGVPEHMCVKFLPETLHAGEKGVMLVTYNPDAIDDWGYRRDDFNIEGTVVDATTLGDARYNTITVSGVLQEDFDSYTEEQLEKAPIMVIGRQLVDFKVVEGTEKVRREIYVVNAGHSPLEIHKVRVDNGAIKAQLKKSRLKPGQSTLLVIEIDPMRARSNVMKSDLYLISNDPSNPSQSIRVVAEFR